MSQNKARTERENLMLPKWKGDTTPLAKVNLFSLLSIVFLKRYGKKEQRTEAEQLPSSAEQH